MAAHTRNMTALFIVILLAVFCDAALAGTVAEANLVAWWKLDGDANDSAGSNNGTPYGGTWTSGIINGALELDGQDDYVLVNDDDSLDFGAGESFSFCIWLRFSTPDGGRFVKYSGTSENGYAIFVNTPVGSAGRISFNTWSAGAVVKPGYSGGYNDSQWHFVCGVRDQSEGMMRLYVDGLLKDELPESSRNLTNSGDLTIGCGNLLTNFFEGQMDDVRIYDKALDESEIKQLYSEGTGYKAFDPNPFNGATSVNPSVVFTWRPGGYAESHDVYLGTDFNDVNDANTSSPEYMGNFDVNNYDPCGLDIGITYYWRVDEVNETEPNLWKGDVWSFKTFGDADGVLYVPSEYPTIQAAIDEANDNDIVIVAPGIYTGSGNRDIDFLGKAITVRSTNPDDSNVVEATVIDCELTDGHRGFRFHSGEEPNSVVSGLTIKRGKVEGGGGGIRCSGASPTIENCIITDNRAYGSDGYDPCGDGDDAHGGAISCVSDSSPVLINCTVSNNRANAGDGGPAYSPPPGGDCYPAGDGGSAYGGAIYCTTGSSITIFNCNITGNNAYGGDAGAPMCGPEADNGSAYGGGIYAKVTINSSILSDNLVKNFGGYASTDTHDAHGGAIYCLGNSSVINCLIINNEAINNWQWAPFFLYYAYGGAIYGSDMTVSNCTIYGNEASYTDYGGIYCTGTATITDCIIWGNGDDIDGCSATYSCIQDGDDCGTNGNICTDPCFVSGPEGNYYLSHIAAGQPVDSPCVDAGSDMASNLMLDASTTRTDEVRDVNIVDMGYHYKIPNPADFNEDGDLNLVDFAVLAAQWLSAPGTPSADIEPVNGDGIVDEFDLSFLCRYWLTE